MWSNMNHLCGYFTYGNLFGIINFLKMKNLNLYVKKLLRI